MDVASDRVDKPGAARGRLGAKPQVLRSASCPQLAHTHPPFAHTPPRWPRCWLRTPAAQQQQVFLFFLLVAGRLDSETCVRAPDVCAATPAYPVPPPATITSSNSALPTPGCAYCGSVFVSTSGSVFLSVQDEMTTIKARHITSHSSYARSAAPNACGLVF